MLVDETKRRPGGVQSFAVGCMLLLGGFFGMSLVGLGCQENVRAGSTRGRVCGSVGQPDDPGWWLAALGPMAVFVAVQKLPERRAAAWWATVAIAAAAFGLYGILVAIVTGNV
jgi:hypothetical protein